MTTAAEYGLGPFRFPRGWFGVARSEDLSHKAVGVHFFGQDFVLYRGRDGVPVMLDAYCPHMGSHLASGGMSVAFSKAPQIEGNSIRCPLHGWRFDANGRCSEIPYSPVPIPRSAHLRAYIVRDYAGFVLTWYDEEGGEPDYELDPLSEWTDPDWLVGPIVNMGEMNVHHAEVVDHHVDKIHDVRVHGRDDIRGWTTRFDGTAVTQLSYHGEGGDLLVLKGGPHSIVEYIAEYRGPSVMIARAGGQVPQILFAVSTPIIDGRTQIWYSLALKRTGTESEEAHTRMFDAIAEATYQGFFEDLDILQKKRPSINPMQIYGDGPFRQMRTWYSQFFVPRADVLEIQARVNGERHTAGDFIAPWARSA